MPVGYCIAIAYLHKTTRFYMLTNAREVSFLPHYKRPPSIFIRSGLDIHSHERTGFLYNHKQRHS